MMGRHRHPRRDTAERLAHAEEAAGEIAERAQRVDDQISLVVRLTEGWRKVHKTNHLAQLFREEGHLG
jgi:hypothetical protein